MTLILIFTKIYVNFYNKRHNPPLYDKVFCERRVDTMRITLIVKKTIARMAKRTASLEANTACPLIGYQPKEPEAVKKLRKF